MASYLSFPDWRNIGKRIGKGLRDILNPPVDTGPSQEERRAQRLRDVLKGFAYFDTFDELIDWRVGDVDPLQQANTPLLERIKSPDKGNMLADCSPTTKTLLCHDYNGGYHDYESVYAPTMDTEMYSCEYLQFIDTFIYFSHKLVCVPPPTWTNLLHRNGVKVLGTFIVEPQTPDVERMLELLDAELIVTKQLATMADIFGFDGWLLNIEKDFPNSIHGLTGKLSNFIISLKSHLGPEKQVFWYDALTGDNKLGYQNGLTSQNVEFARAADALFTNYKWTEKHLAKSKKVAEAAGIDISSVYFGIDVWAQNTNMPGPPRITYPSKGGGGTNTGSAMKTLASVGFSTAIFAPGWTHEHFPTTPDVPNFPEDISIAKAVERAMWNGATLPSDLHCGCKDITQSHLGPPSQYPKVSTEGKSPHHTQEYRSNRGTKYAREAPAGSPSFFYTDFRRAFETVSTGSTIQVRSFLGLQTPLPHLIPTSTIEFDDTDKGCHQQYLLAQMRSEFPGLDIYACERGAVTRESIGKIPDTPTQRLRLHLFKLSMPIEPGLIIRSTYQASPNILKEPNPNTSNYGIYTSYNDDPATTQYHPTTHDPDSQDHGTPSVTRTHTITLSKNPNRLTSIGIYLTPPPEHPPQPILTILSLFITPSLSPLYEDCPITNIRLIFRGQAPNLQKRLTWNWSAVKGQRGPWSQITGPFAWFEVWIDQVRVGQVCGTEFPILDKDHAPSEGDGMDIIIIGVLFDGRKVKSSLTKIEMGDIS